MKNPLHKRLPRELKSEFGKYAVVFFLMVATIGFVSGFLVADNSMLIAYNESFEKYNIEDGNFRTADRIYRSQRENIEKLGIRLYENYYIEELDNGNTMRFFKNREEVNKVCLMEGVFPEHTGEIAIDRMYADNNQLSVGDTLTSKDKSWKITGLVALSDYSCLFQNNNDSMFDSVKFGVSVVTADEFDSLNQDKLQYNYSWKYNQEPSDEKEEKEISEDLMEDIGAIVTLETFVPRYTNQAITFTGEDMGGDRAMIIMLLYIIMVIMAFVFGITISNTIRKEAGVIGTLRASGYTRRELVLHYMELPVMVTLAGALIGNILGYTVLKNVCAGMYYGSYSLPTYKTVWNAEAFLLTTISSGADYAGGKLQCTAAQAASLSTEIPAQGSVRKETEACHCFKSENQDLFQISSQSYFSEYEQLCGTFYRDCVCQSAADVRTAFAISGSKLEELLNLAMFYMDVRTDNDDAEKFSAYSLNTLPGKYKSEEVLLYGVEPDSKYVKADLEDGAYISSAYADKFQIQVGDTITLKEKYEKDEYSFQVDGIYDYTAGLCVFMERDKLNETFDLEDDYYSGYFSDTEITDIRKKYIGSVVDLDALTKISRQLDVSMGSMMGLVNGFAILIYMVLIYLLSKIIIEKNAQSISMVKILGYTNGEISRLYIMSTSIVVVICLLVSLPIERAVMEVLFREMMLASISGWITMWVDPMIYVQMFAAGLLTYVAVALLEFRKIKKVPMDEALKNVE